MHVMGRLRILKAKEWLHKVISAERPATVSILLFIAIFIVNFVLQPQPFVNWLNIKTEASMTLIFCALGQSLVLLIGGIDLSIGGILSLTNCLSALYMVSSFGSILGMSLLTLLIGAVIGLINGLIIVRFNIQPFIVTFANWFIWGGISLLVLPMDGGTPPTEFINSLLGRIGGISASFIIIIILALLWTFIKRTNYGISIYAVGSNEKAAFLNGINVNFIKISVYSISGFLAACAGLFRTAQVASGSPTAGDSFFMLAIAAAVIGGTSLVGGKGGLIGAIFGAVVLKMIADVLQFAGISSYWSALCQGILLIITVAIGSISEIIKIRREEVL